MKTPAYSDAKPLEVVLPAVAGKSEIHDRLRREFGTDTAERMIKMMQTGALENVMAGELQDFLSDDIYNESTIVWEGLISSCDDDYPVTIYAYHGIHHVWAVEHDRVGYFLSFNRAKDYVFKHWENVSSQAI